MVLFVLDWEVITLEAQVQQSGYQAQYNAQIATAPVMSVKEWLITSIILMIPVVNIIMFFVWAFGGGANPNKANWAKATILLFAIIIGLYVVFGVILFGVFASTFN